MRLKGSFIFIKHTTPSFVSCLLFLFLSSLSFLSSLLTLPLTLIHSHSLQLFLHDKRKLIQPLKQQLKRFCEEHNPPLELDDLVYFYPKENLHFTVITFDYMEDNTHELLKGQKYYSQVSKVRLCSSSSSSSSSSPPSPSPLVLPVPLFSSSPFSFSLCSFLLFLLFLFVLLKCFTSLFFSLFSHSFLFTSSFPFFLLLLTLLFLNSLLRVVSNNFSLLVPPPLPPALRLLLSRSRFTGEE
jgi:hypothetical protein